MRVPLSAERADRRRYDSLLGNAGFPVIYWDLPEAVLCNTARETSRKTGECEA